MKDGSYGALQRLLYRIAVKRLMEAFDAALDRAKIARRRLSEEAGMPPNAFTSTKNEMEDPRLSTFLRYYCAAVRLLSSMGAEEISVDSMIRDSAAAKIIDLADEIALAGAGALSDEDSMRLFASLKQDVLLLTKKGAVSEEELAAFSAVCSMIQGGCGKQ